MSTTKNSVFTVYIAEYDGTIQVSAEVPQEVALAVEQHWENPFKLETGAGFKAAYELVTKKFFKQEKSLVFDHNFLMTYMGGSPLTLTLDLEFVVNDDINNDLISHVKNLMKLASPGEGTKNAAGKLTGLKKPKMVSISIGNFIYFREARITNVNTTFMRPFLSDTGFKGAPAKVVVPISIITNRIVTRERVDEIFFNSKLSNVNIQSKK